MQKSAKYLVLVMQLIFVVSCSHSDGLGKDIEKVRMYSLCPKTDDALEELPDQLRHFSYQQRAQLTDRSSSAQQELIDIGSDVLGRTGGSPIMLTVVKPDDFLLSVTNLGLREKVVVAITWWDAQPEANSASSLLEGLSHSWAITQVDGAVTDSPPCAK